MILGTITQQPAENLDYDVNYADWLYNDDRVALVSLDVQPPYDAATNPQGLQVSSVIHGGLKVKLWISGGVNGVTYKITLTASTEQNRIKQDELKVKIKDI